MMKGKMFAVMVFSLYLFVVALPGAYGASFDCEKASTPVEKMICADSRLSDLDEVAVKFYKKVLADSANSESVKAAQRGWVRDIRNRCRDIPCLARAYDDRVKALTGEISKSAAGKPVKVNHYSCKDGTKLQTSSGDGFETMILTFKKETWHLARLISASGERYGNGRVVFWGKGGEAFVEINDEVVLEDCVVKK